MNILVSNPSLLEKSLYLPYLWARFKTYIDLDFDKEVDVNWLRPITSYDASDLDLTQKIDVLALSCYTWNWKRNLKLAEKVKEVYPDCIVVAGGPHVDFTNPNVFENTDIDVICYAEGEKVFAELVYALQNSIDIDSVPGIITKENPTKERPVVPKLDLSTLSSPWLHCQAELAAYADELRNQDCRVCVAFETNRGCPYSCSFCDWGSATNSKLKKFRTDLVLEEIEVMMNMRPDMIFITDANYGVYKEDFDFVKKLVECKEKTQHETAVVLMAAKNKKTVLAQCYSELQKAGMIQVAQLGIQHTDPEVLSLIDRDNIKMEDSLYQMEESWEYGVPLVPALIAGNPGDTINKWKKCLGDMARMGFHEDIRVHDFMLLPNAPAMSEEYFTKYKLGILSKPYADQPTDRILVESNFLVESFSYTRDDWIEMQVLSYFFQACHVLSVTKFVSMLAYHTFDIEYEDFYDYIKNLPVVQQILKPVYDLFNNYMYGDRTSKFIEYKNLKLTVENYIYLQLIDNIDELYDQFTLDLGEYTDSIIEFQKFVVLNINNHKDSITIDHDFRDYFKNILLLPAFKKSQIQPTNKVSTYKKDKRVGMHGFLDTSAITTVEQLSKKIFKVIYNRRHKMFYHPGVFDYDY